MLALYILNHFQFLLNLRVLLIFIELLAYLRLHEAPLLDLIDFLHFLYSPLLVNFILNLVSSLLLPRIILLV